MIRYFVNNTHTQTSKQTKKQKMRMIIFYWWGEEKSWVEKICGISKIPTKEGERVRETAANCQSREHTFNCGWAINRMERAVLFVIKVVVLLLFLFTAKLVVHVDAMICQSSPPLSPPPPPPPPPLPPCILTLEREAHGECPSLSTR